MKKIIFCSLICFMALQVNAQWVDLGLPSGTKWKVTNEYGNGSGFYNYNTAVSKFGRSLPTRKQWEELKSYCSWTWRTSVGYEVKGPNGNSIVLPAVGIGDCDGEIDDVNSYGGYWSSTPYFDEDRAWGFFIDSGGEYYFYRCMRLSVRLVQ